MLLHVIIYSGIIYLCYICSHNRESIIFSCKTNSYFSGALPQIIESYILSQDIHISALCPHALAQLGAPECPDLAQLVVEIIDLQRIVLCVCVREREIENVCVHVAEMR
jgi:hypothetical protein